MDSDPLGRCRAEAVRQMADLLGDVQPSANHQGLPAVHAAVRRPHGARLSRESSGSGRAYIQASVRRERPARRALRSDV